MKPRRPSPRWVPQRAMRDCLHERLGDVVANNMKIIAVTRNLGFFTNSYNYLTQLIPLAARRTHVHAR